MMKRIVIALFAALPLLAHAYVGPGAGLGMIASLLAVVGAMLLSIVGLILWPWRVLKKRWQAKSVGRDRHDS
jgi:protein-S-isoprenylcysteine O-methyltransferase Ste14